MVFPQAEFVIIPDSQAASPDYETMRSESINPKNPDVADILRLLSLKWRPWMILRHSPLPVVMMRMMGSRVLTATMTTWIKAAISMMTT